MVHIGTARCHILGIGRTGCSSRLSFDVELSVEGVCEEVVFSITDVARWSEIVAWTATESESSQSRARFQAISIVSQHQMMCL